MTDLSLWSGLRGKHLSGPAARPIRRCVAEPLHHRRGGAIRTLALIALLASGLFAQTPSRVRATSLLDDVSRGFHPGAAGFLDLFQANSLLSGASYERPYGTLEGYVQRRRIAALMQDPDSLAAVRWGLLGAWDQGGWTDDAYFGWAGGSHEDIVLWTWGVACAVPALQADVVGGVVNGRKVSWRGNIDDETIEASSWSGFVLGRWKRISNLAVTDEGGLEHLRLGFEPTPWALRATDPMFVPQIQGAVSWSQAAWNRWEPVDAVGAEIGLPLWKDRILARFDAGDEGFRQARVECDLSSEGVIGLDVSYARTRSGRRLPGVRVRIPLLTFGWNDPEDAAAFGTDPEWPVWSMRLQMVWEGPEIYYRPGRRPSPGKSR